MSREEIAQRMRDDTLRHVVDPRDAERNGHAGGSSNGKPAAARKPDSIGRFQTVNVFVDQSARLVSPKAVSTWLVLWRETKSNGLATIAHSQIAERLGVTARTVRRAARELETAGLITVVARGGLQNGGQSSTYRVNAKPKKPTPKPRTALS
ncbi:helix-turn-helix domain-containing protein [Pirellulales bacterium]|nr:helix-turn-helix domain-containing protein [Pirellulales bacterium]